MNLKKHNDTKLWSAGAASRQQGRSQTPAAPTCPTNIGKASSAQRKTQYAAKSRP